VGAERGYSRDWVLRTLAFLTGCCLIAGIFARFDGLGRWPLTVDEYYLAQSVQNILREGLPRYACGGLYVRGLALQYTSVLLQYAGLSAELAPRLIAALCSLIALPAVYLLGRRAGGRNIGLLAVAILAISVWEAEVARFGRMYAPFQAVFLWYVVCFLSYTLDRRRRALVPMLVLSALGVLVWEGGVFLALANLLPPFIRTPSGRLESRDWKYLAGCALLVLPIYWFATADLRTRGGEPTLPDDYREPTAALISRLDSANMPLATLHLHPLWALAALLPVLLALYAVVRLARAYAASQSMGAAAAAAAGSPADEPPGPLALLGCSAALGCALMQQFGLTIAIVLLMGLLCVLDWRALFRGHMWPFHAAILASLLFWCAFALSTPEWHVPGLTGLRADFLLAYQFVRFPDVVRQIAAPWAHSVPVLSTALFVLIGAACIHACLLSNRTQSAERVLLALLVIFVLAAGGSHPPRQETRYVFFLYPLAILLAVLCVARIAHEIFGSTRFAAAATVLLVLGGFALTEDFRPRHLWNIDTEAVTFRIGMSPREAAHYQERSDTRSAARWLAAHVDRSHDMVINSFPGVDFYYPHANFYYMEETDPRFESWSCRRGRFERWSNLPLLHSAAALRSELASGRRVWLVLESSRLAQLEASFPAGTWQLEWSSREHDIAILSSHETPSTH
jgi:4-amino-4-deoxy-L-arabinose transferase-like glycosyltransferase